MSIKARRIISAMTPEAVEKVERFEAEGRDPITGRKLCERVDCGCELTPGNTNITRQSIIKSNGVN
jgi:hypothetical protein